MNKKEVKKLMDRTTDLLDQLIENGEYENYKEFINPLFNQLEKMEEVK